MNVIDDIKTMLTGIESNIFMGSMPDTPDSLICIYNTGGFDPVRTLKNDLFLQQPTFQIMLRDSTYQNGYERCNSIINVLDGITNNTINGHFYLSIMQSGDILPLGDDSKKRKLFSINFNTQIIR